MILIKFKKAHDYLDTLNIPRLVEYKSNVIIERIDFTEQENEGNIKWRDDGVYLKIKDNFQRGFMYIKRPYLSEYNKNVDKIDDLPRFHLVKCSMIKKKKDDNDFDDRYFWSNSPSISLFDYHTGDEYQKKTLKLCWHCKKIITENISNTNDFHNLLDVNDDKVEKNEVETNTDINGRPFDWRSISRAYREEHNYTCEECGFGGEDLNNYDRRYIETHHIISNELSNTHRDNLKSVCILCHSKQDEHHKLNFEKRKTKMKLRNFIKKYKAKLIEIRNPHIKNYIIENEV